MGINKNKSYRFRGDSERVQWNDAIRALAVGTAGWIGESAAEHLHERGILLEYPELPGEDWEFCERVDAERVWCELSHAWEGHWCSECQKIYCRKKKPVITEVEVVVESHYFAGDRIYLPAGFAGPGDRVKVTKL